MQELIKIDKQLIGAEEVNSVNARELHAELGVKKDFSDWMGHQVNSFGLEMNIDYIVNIENSNGGRPQKSYTLTLDTAKHIAMASRTTKGKEVRAYFIAIEKQFRNGTTTQSSEFSQFLPVMMEMVSGMSKMMEMMGTIINNQTNAVSQHLTPTQLDQIKLAINRAAKPLADCHGISWGRAIKEVYTELNGRMGVFAYYHISPNDFDDALKLLERMKEVKELELKTGEAVRLNIEIHVGGVA